MRSRFLIVTALGLSACGNKREDSASEAPAATTTAAAPAAPDAGYAVWPATLEDRTFDITWHDMHATLKGRVPVGWISRSEGSFKVDDGGDPSIMDPSISYSFGNMSCDGPCDDGDMQRSMAEMWANTEERYGRVSYNMGSSDALRLDVKTVEEGTFPDGKYKAVRVTIGANAKGAPDYLERLEATCVRHRKGDKFYIFASTSMKLTYEKTLWPLMLEACKTPWFR